LPDIDAELENHAVVTAGEDQSNLSLMRGVAAPRNLGKACCRSSAECQAQMMDNAL
jgi:hypothetical protein